MIEGIISFLDRQFNNMSYPGGVGFPQPDQRRSGQRLKAPQVACPECRPDYLPKKLTTSSYQPSAILQKQRANGKKLVGLKVDRHG